MDIWYNFTKSVIRVYMSLFTDGMQVIGNENIPSGPKIIIANHAYASDVFALPFIFPDKLHFFVQSEIFTVPIVGRLLALADQIPVVIGQGREALKAARDWLATGDSVVIFPEGQLNHAEGLRRAGNGAAILALQSGAPLLPLGIYVPPEFIKNIRSHMFNRTTLGGWQMHGMLFVRIGEPCLPQVNAAVDIADRSYRSVRELTNRMMEQINGAMQQAQQLALSYLPPR